MALSIAEEEKERVPRRSGVLLPSVCSRKRRILRGSIDRSVEMKPLKPEFDTKYGGLGRFLKNQKRPRLTLSFDQVEQFIEGKLPASARRTGSWWRGGGIGIELDRRVFYLPCFPRPITKTRRVS